MVNEKNFLINKNYIPITGVIRDRVLEYDARLIYKSDKKVPRKYIRDSKGYRSRSINSLKQIVLTKGGSTTDQRYVTEGNTWQDILDSSIPEYDFIKGGIDGDSYFVYARISSRSIYIFYFLSSINIIVL